MCTWKVGEWGLRLENRAVQTVNDFWRQVKFGISLVGNGEPWKVLEEEKRITRSMLRVFLTHACVAPWTAGTPVSRRAAHRVQGVPRQPPLASDVLNSALDSSLTQIKPLNFGPSLCLGIHFTIEKWGQ